MPSWGTARRLPDVSLLISSARNGPAAATVIIGAVVASIAIATSETDGEGRADPLPENGPRAVAVPILPGMQSSSVPYNARFTFTRLRYDGPGFRRRGAGSWSHDYPDADLNIPTILEFVTTIHATTGASNVFTLDDPRLFQHPMLYISEPGYWSITDSEARNLRDYVLKGGFLVFDDFEGNQLYNMVAQVERALPGFELIEIGPDHEIFDSFFYVENIYIPHPLVPVTPVYYGIFEDNDPSKRMLAIVNHNNDLAEYWEWSATGYFPVDITNEAYKLGVNYIVYALTH